MQDTRYSSIERGVVAAAAAAGGGGCLSLTGRDEDVARHGWGRGGGAEPTVAKANTFNHKEWNEGSRRRSMVAVQPQPSPARHAVATRLEGIWCRAVKILGDK